MKTSKVSKTVVAGKGKIMSVLFLFTMSVLIILSGVFFTIYSLCFGISFKVINTSVPGSIFGAAVLYLGIRYFISVLKLRREVYKSSSKFSWSNFKTGKQKG